VSGRYGKSRPSTKAELVRIRSEFETASTGVELLERKRDALMMEGLSRLKQAREMRRQISVEWGLLEVMWEKCLQVESRSQLLRLSEAVRQQQPLQGGERNWMSVALAEYDCKKPTLELLGAVSDCGLLPEKVRGRLATLLPALLRLMNLETIVRRIALALKRCQRQVNALNNVIVPELNDEKRRIEQRLEEKERESLFLIKRLKARAR
jgi:V/A-type H+-transporting ATPase subunit D